MRKHKRSSSLFATTKQNLIFGEFLYQKDINDNKRGNGVKDCSLRSLTPRPRLFCAVGLLAGISITLGIVNTAYNTNVSAVSATLSIPEGISINVDPSQNNGFAESSNGAVSVSTGNQMGYTLTIKAKDNNQLKNGSNVLNSISTNLTADQYKAGNYVNTWGFKPSSINNESNTSYVPGPTTSGITLASTHASSNDAENYSIGIAAKVDSNIVAGNYTNTFTIAATANEATYTIKYNTNGGSPTPATQSDNFDTETTVTIEGAAPTNSNGKDFLGWCTEDPGDSDTCTGALIQPGGKFPLCKCDLNITLYAMYGKKVNPEGSFSGIADGTACKVETGYTAKVYGEKCWMWADYQVGSTKTWTWQNAQSICPTGWHLPSQAEFQTLINHIGNKSQLYNAGWNDMYWSSTPHGDDAYFLSVDRSNVYLNYGGDTGWIGFARGVRCVAG